LNIHPPEATKLDPEKQNLLANPRPARDQKRIEKPCQPTIMTWLQTKSLMNNHFSSRYVFQTSLVPVVGQVKEVLGFSKLFSEFF
jgi:hypothetical protein